MATTSSLPPLPAGALLCARSDPLFIRQLRAAAREAVFDEDKHRILLHQLEAIGHFASHLHTNKDLVKLDPDAQPVQYRFNGSTELKQFYLLKVRLIP